MGLKIDVEVSGPDITPAARTARDLLRRAVRAALAAEEVADAEVSVALLDDAAMSELNARYLGQSRPTDVLSFPLHGPGEPVVGDIYIGREQALRQAQALGVPAQEELVRLAVHGTLHVLGHTHPEDAERERSPMWELQERIVAEVMGT